MSQPRWEVTGRELEQLRVAVGRIAQHEELDAALAALASWALALIDAGAILIALRAWPGEPLLVRAAAGRGTARNVGVPLSQIEPPVSRRGGPWLRVPIARHAGVSGDGGLWWSEAADDAVAARGGEGADGTGRGQEGADPVRRGRELVGRRGRAAWRGGRAGGGEPVPPRDEAGIVVARPKLPRRLRDEDAELLRLLAAQAGIAIAQDAADRQIADLYRLERRRAEQLAAAAALGHTLARLSRLGDVLEYAVGVLKSHFGYDRVALYLRDDRESDFVLRAAAGSGPRPGNRLDLDGATATAWAARHGEPQLIVDRRMLGSRLIGELEVASELAVPIGDEERPIGVLALASARAGAFDPGDLQLAESIADELSIAIQNLRLAAQAREDAAAAERARVARELHDETAQQLVAIGRRLDLLHGELGKPDASGRIEAIQDMVDDVLLNVRRISRDLRPAVLEDLGLVAALEAVVADAQRSGGPEVRFEVVGMRRALAPRAELALYRIGQEALTNSLRHATASSVALELAFDEEGATLTVSDDGRGFAMPTTLAELEKGGGLGVVGMRERAGEVGGRLELEAAPGRGATVRVRVPG